MNRILKQWRDQCRCGGLLTAHHTYELLENGLVKHSVNCHRCGLHWSLELSKNISDKLKGAYQ